MPVPYPGLHKPGGRRGDRDVPRKLALNATVLVLSWLYLGQPGALSQPGPLALGSTLSKEQWAIVGTLERNTEACNSQPLVGPADMGRSAAKVESCEEILRALEVRAASVASTTDRRPTGAGQAEFLASESYGTLGIEPCVLAQPIQADRLRFLGRPEFDPMPFLDKGSREVYQHPLRFARELPPEEQVPRTQVRCSRSEALKLLHVLDASGRLALRPVSATRPRLYNGLFAIAKDLERDRMILDARGPNQVESTEQPWLRSMASVEQLQWLQLKADEDMTASTEDLREYYHCFEVEGDRVLRNALAMVLTPAEAEGLGCYCPSMAEHGPLRPCLQTLAMGDCCAVGFGQTAHLSVLLRSGALDLSQFVSLSGRPPRRGLVAGLLIDDLAVLEAVPKGSDVGSHEAPAVMAKIHGVPERR